MDFEKFEALKPEEQEKVFHETPFKERGDLLLRAHNPLGLAHSLSAEELYLLVREVDLEEKSEILRFATLPQLFFISDVDCWKKDRMNPKGFTDWLKALLAADEGKCLKWLIEMDYETVVTGFKKVAGVLKPDREWAVDEILGDVPYFTLDEQYFISVRDEELELVRRIFELLYENVRGKYFAILEGMMAESEDELEEEAYHRRETRLSERGFPDFETAHRLYRPISREEFDSHPRKNGNLPPAAGTDRAKNPPPNYPVLWSAERLFLDEILLLFREDTTGTRERLEEELAWLSNKVIAAEGIDFSSEERVRQGIERARSFVSIGLEILTRRDREKAKIILSERWLETIFRWTMTHLLAAREEALTVIREEWDTQREVFLQFLNPPYEFIFKGILLPVPEFYDFNEKEDLSGLRDFRSLDEVQRTIQGVRQIACFHALLKSKFSDAYHVWRRECSKGNSGVTLFSILGTLFVQFVLQQEGTGLKTCPPSQPFIDPKYLKAFMEKAFDKKGARRFLKPEWKEKFLKDARNDMAPLLSLVFDEVEDDFTRLNPSSFDPRFISSVCLALKGKANVRPKKKTRSRA